MAITFSPFGASLLKGSPMTYNAKYGFLLSFKDKADLAFIDKVEREQQISRETFNNMLAQQKKLASLLSYCDRAIALQI